MGIQGGKGMNILEFDHLRNLRASLFYLSNYGDNQT